MITPNSRIRLTADDFDYIVRTLSIKSSDRVSLQRLLTEPAVRDEILDHEALGKALLESPERLTISTHLLFYVLCRRVLRDTPVKSRDAADYIAAMLGHFSSAERVYEAEGTGRKPSRYYSDMLACLENADDREAFILRTHMANYALFVSGMFAENVEKRTERGAPNILFYEKMGGMNYRVAAEYRDAKRFELSGIFEEISKGFHDVRLALNDLATRLLHIDSPQPPIITA